MRNLRNGRGLCLPDQTVETLHATSLRKKQRPNPQNQDVPQNNICDIRRGEPRRALRRKISFAQYGRHTSTRKRANHYSSLPLILIFICFLFNNAALAQSHEEGEAVAGVEEIVPLRVGDKVPDEFWTREHLFYVDGDTVRRTLEEYKGRPFILDFWASWCGMCVQSFPKNVELQKKLQDRMPFLLVHSDMKYDNLDDIQRVLSNTVHFGGRIGSSIIFDTYLKGLFPHRAIPHYVWIDHTHRIRAITVFDFVSLAQMETIINRKKGDRNND